jgi:multiple sugar transport system permease protein
MTAVKPPPAETAPQRQKGGRFAALRRRHTWVPWLFLAPNLAVFGLFMFFPLLYAAYMSLHDWSLIGTAEFTGLDNYQGIATDGLFWRSLVQTLIYTVGTVPSAIALGLAVALLLNRRLRGRLIVRSIFFVPVIIAGVVVALLGAWLFNDNYGVVNAVLGRIGIGPIPWLTSPRWALLSLIIVTLWTRIGFCMVVYLAALQGVPRDVYEAAQVDGATGWQRFRWITWPFLGPTTFLLVVVNVIYSFHVFDLIYVMTGGGPGFSTTVLVQYIYQQAFELGNMGYATALGVVVYFLMMAFTLFYWRVSRQSSQAA